MRRQCSAAACGAAWDDTVMGEGQKTPTALLPLSPAYGAGSWLGVLLERSPGFCVNKLHAIPSTHSSCAAHKATYWDSVRGHDGRMAWEHYLIVRSAVHSDACAHIHTRPGVYQTGDDHRQLKAKSSNVPSLLKWFCNEMWLVQYDRTNHISRGSTSVPMKLYHNQFQ